MRKLIAAGSGCYGKALKECVESLQINADCMAAVSMTDREQFHRDLISCLREVGEKDEVVILCDLEASPAALEIMLDLEKFRLLGRTLMLYGINSAGAAAAVRYLDAVDTLQELAQTVQSEAKAGISMSLSQN